MSVLLIGALGNMGRRYLAILNHLNIHVTQSDIGLCTEEHWGEILKRTSRVIVATPTDTHAVILRSLMEANPRMRRLDVLCEKPISKSLKELEDLRNECTENRVHLYVVNQYNYIPKAWEFSELDSLSHWDYFKSGNDGLQWDCFQIFAMANGKVKLSTKSPIWSCAINGHKINIKYMDGAYVRMIQDFCGKQERLWGFDKIIETTKRVLAFNE